MICIKRFIRIADIHKKKIVCSLLLFVLIISLFSSATFVIYSQTTEQKQNKLITTSDEPKQLTPYDYISSTTPGKIGRNVVNQIFYRNWLNNTITWRVEKSTDNIKWDNYEKFEVKKDYNSTTLTEKYTIIVTSDEDAYYRILTNTNKENQLVRYCDRSTLPDELVLNETSGREELKKVASNDYELTFRVTDEQTYTVLYNWDDYLNSDIVSKSSFSKNVKTDSLSSKQFFEWSVVSSIKIKKGESFVLDPVYGVIANAVVDSFEWDTADGRAENPDAFVRLGDSNYFMTSGRGTNSDGFLTVIEVNDNGTFVKSVVSEWEYDITDGSYAGILHISGDIYAVYYMDASNGVLFTTRAYASNGTLQKTKIDSGTYTKPFAQHLIHVTGDIYALSYQEVAGGYDHFLETYEITSAGAISARIDFVEYDQSSTSTSLMYAPHMAMVDTDTVAIVMADSAADGMLFTYNISGAGDITNTYSGYWEFDGTYGLLPHIKKISGNVFAITYLGTGYDGFVKTLTIADTGAITKSWIDELEFDTADCYYPTMFTVADASSYNPGVYGITYAGVNYDGFVVTMNITSAGAIDAAVIDSLKFDTADNTYYAPTIHVAGDTYVICYTGTGTDGWAVTVNITTPGGVPPFVNTAPTQSNNNPINNTGCNDINPKLTIFVYDDNGNTMNITWLSNSSGSWVEFGSNLSVVNGTYNMSTTNFSSCNTTYFWTVSLSDGNGGYNNMTYHLRTSGESLIYIVNPKNESTNVKLTPILKIYANNTCGKLLNIYWYENSTGSFVLRQSNLSVSANNTYQYVYAGANDFNTTYGWKVAVNSTSCNVSQTCTFRTYQEPATHIALYGLTDFWNMTWSANEDNATGIMPEIVYTNNSGVNYETMIINCIVNSTERISNVTITHDELNLSTDYGTKLYADNITVWVSANGGDFFIPNCDLGYGKGRFTPTGGSINLNVTSWDGAMSPFSDYYNGTNGAISENCTILLRLQLNVTLDTPHGYFVNQTYLSGGSPYIYAYNYSGIYSEIIYFTSQARIYGNPMNYGVVLSHENPANNSVGQPMGLTWNITAEDPNGNVFDWSIECYGQSNNGLGGANGSKSVNLVMPNWCTTYKVYVNATDGANWTNEWFLFTTQSMPNATLTNPTPANGSNSNNYSLLNWTIDIKSPAGEWFNYTIECAGQTRSGNYKTNNTFNITLVGLQQATTYRVYVNVTNNCSNTTSAWYTFTTKSNSAPTISHENPINGSTNQALALTINVTIEDPNGDPLNWSIECYGQSNSAVTDTNGSKSLVVTNLDWCHTYYWYVNTTDSNGGIVNRTYWFTTASMSNVTISNPIPTNGSTGQLLNFNYSIDLTNPTGELFRMTIQCNNSQINYTNLTVNGTYYLNLTGLSYNTQYKVWVNVTNNCSNETRVWFTFTTRINHAPIVHHEYPTNKTTNHPVGEFILNATIEDPDGGTFDYSWYCTNGDFNSANGNTNGSKIFMLSGALDFCTNYTLYVNVTDGVTSSNYTFWFVTRPMASCIVHNPNPTNNSLNNDLAFTWNVTIESPNGTTFDWTIECYGNTNSGNADSNGSKTLAITALDWCTNYTVYVNTTNDCSNNTNNYYYFTTQAMPNATISNPISVNGSTGQLTSFNWSIDINSPSGEWFNVTIQCNNGNINYSNNSVNGTFYINLTGLSQSTTYIVWVNVTNNCSNETREWFTFTTRGNNAPIQHNEIPTNHSINVPLIDDDKHVNLNVTIEDPDGNTMNYTITVSGGIFSQGFDVTNGSIVCVPTDLEYCTNYTWYVNVTDRYTWTNQTYWFVTEAMPACVAHNPNPVNNSIHNLLGFTWNVTIESPKSEWFNWTIECAGQSNSGNDETNGSKTLALTGLDWCTNYTVYVNTTNNCSNASNFYYYFTTQAMSNVTVSNPNPANNSVNVGLAFNFSVDVNSPNGEWFDIDMTCNNSDTNSSSNSINGTYYLNITGLSYLTTYVVWVNTTNNCSNETRVWFTFTTLAEPISNPVFVIECLYPINNSNITNCVNGIPICVNISLDGSCEPMNLSFYSNSSGAWVFFSNLTISSNGSYCVLNINFTGNATYYWNASVTNATIVNKSSVFKFTTNATTGDGFCRSYTWVIGLVIVFSTLSIAFIKNKKIRRMIDRR